MLCIGVLYVGVFYIGVLYIGALYHCITQSPSYCHPLSLALTHTPHTRQAQKCAIKVEIINEKDVTKLKGIIAGPPDTPFEGEGI